MHREPKTNAHHRNIQTRRQPREEEVGLGWVTLRTALLPLMEAQIRPPSLRAATKKSPVLPCLSPPDPPRFKAPDAVEAGSSVLVAETVRRAATDRRQPACRAPSRECARSYDPIIIFPTKYLSCAVRAHKRADPSNMTFRMEFSARHSPHHHHRLRAWANLIYPTACGYSDEATTR